MMKDNIFNKTQDQDKNRDNNNNYENKISEVNRKNKSLQKDLDTAYQQIQKNEDVIRFNQDLLKTRASFIDTLQEKESSTSKQIKYLQEEIIKMNKSDPVHNS